MTIAKIMQNHSFRATFQYAVSKNGARIIGGNVAPWLERDQLSDKQLEALISSTVKQFMMSADLNPEIKRPVYHLSISLPPHENLNDENLSKFCEFFVAALILTAQQPDLLKNFDAPSFRDKVENFRDEELHQYQYSIVRHADSDHAHAHIIASKINLETESAIATSYDYYRAQKILRDLERQYDLTVLENSWEVGRRAETRRQIQTELETGVPSAQKQIQDALDRAIADSRTVTEFIEKALLEGIEVRVNFTRTGKPKGISYALDDVPMAGNRLGNRYSFPGLQKQSGLSYDAMRDDDQIRELCQQKPSSLEEHQSTTPETEAVSQPIEQVSVERNAGDIDLLIASFENNFEDLVSEELEQFESETIQQIIQDEVDLDLQTLFDASQSRDVPGYTQDLDDQRARASTITPIAARLFEYCVETGKQAYKDSPDSDEWIYRVVMSDRAYLVSRNDTSGDYNVRCEDSVMSLQPPQGITDRDVATWQDLSQWLEQQVGFSSSSQVAEPISAIQTEDDWQQSQILDSDHLYDDFNESATATIPQESEFAKQQRFAQAIAAEIRWLAQIGSINGNHYTLSQTDDQIHLARKNEQVIGSFPLDPAQSSVGFAITELDVERFQAIQQQRWAIEVSEIALASWREAGEPPEILGKQYDVYRSNRSLYLHRRGEANSILEIPLDENRSPSGQQLTQTDYDYFAQAKTQIHQNEVSDSEHER